MSNFSNYINTLCYNLSRKKEPTFNNYSKIITDFSELSPKSTSPFNLSARHYNNSGPSSDGLFVAEKLTIDERTQIYSDFVKYYSQFGDVPEPKYAWDYKSMACHSYDKFRIDIYKPGRIVTKCTLPKYGVASPWLYTSMNKGDFDNPWLQPIDKPTEPRDYYFEIDIIETFMNPDRAVFSGHYGTQTNRKIKSKAIMKYLPGEHYCEVVWDGKGNWKWLLNSVVVNRKFIPQPESIYPFFKLTLSIIEPFPSGVDRVEWKVDYVKFSDNIIEL